MNLKKALFSTVCLLVILMTACTSDDITVDESTMRESELEGNTIPVTATVRVVKDTVVRIHTINNTRIKNTVRSSTRRRN
ncbi:hypothetical protein C8N46_11191 [Kordia periserrulae]|uniref:YnbE-like lipoprotein n=1 Tax=Kordia periserrulae TaxID=701523 RepID=A0A2T6BSH2_9FLAO|nr:hypothetical protein [Kordia periserrulae]PTX59022.1 hypothetical protein C8N46_11191 [Kordia periserrulae]